MIFLLSVQQFSAACDLRIGSDGPLVLWSNLGQSDADCCLLVGGSPFEPRSERWSCIAAGLFFSVTAPSGEKLQTAQSKMFSGQTAEQRRRQRRWAVRASCCVWQQHALRHWIGRPVKSVSGASARSGAWELETTIDSVITYQPKMLTWG